MVPTLFFYTGAIVLVLMSFQDFKEKVFKLREPAAYYLCFILFIALNLIVYFGFCTVAIDVDAVGLLTGRTSSDIGPEKKILPLIIAFAYFGIGTVKIPLGQKAGSFYGVILDIFQGMFRLDKVDITPLKKEIEQKDAETDKLTEAVDFFVQKGEDQKWEILKEEWIELKKENEQTEAYTRKLQKVSDELDLKNLPETRIRNLSVELREDVNQIKKEIKAKILKHIVRLVRTNEKSHSAIEYLLTNIGLSVPTQPQTSQFLVRLNRAIVISLFSGILIGSIKMHFDRDLQVEVSAHEIFRWMISIGIFGALFSFVAGVKKKHLFKAIALGGIAGGLGHLSLTVTRLLLDDATKDFWAAIVKWLPNLPIGASFGASLAIMTYVFQHHLRHKIQKHIFAYLAMGGTGSVLFVLLAWLERIVQIRDLTTLGMLATIGFLIALTVAVVTDIFHSD